MTDSELLLLITDKRAIVSLVSFVTFMVMPVGILKFINYMLGENRILEILCRMFYGMAVIYLVNYMFPVVTGYILILPVHLMCFLSIIIVFWMGHKKLKSREQREMSNCMGRWKKALTLLLIRSLRIWISLRE